MKLNLGCGDKKREGYINVDVCGEPDVKVDLDCFPWPWKDDSVDEVYSTHFLEHVRDYEKTILEIHRILKPDGILHFIVPHYRAPTAVWHLHKWSFSTFTPELLCSAIPYQYGGVKLFEKDCLWIRFQGLFAGRFLSRMLEFLANISPLKWDILGLPVEAIEFKGRKFGRDARPHASL